MNLQPPIKDFDWIKNISQMFGVNMKFYQEHFDMPAHNGLDIVIRDIKLGYGSPILASHNGKIVQIIYDTPHKTRGNGIYLLDESEKFTTIYWHLSGFECQIGQEVKVGQTIGLMGNSGQSFPKPTQQLPWLGTHLHFGVRSHEFLNKSQREDYDGFLDPAPLLFKEGDKLPVRWNRDLWYKSWGDDVSWLQTCLKLEGLGKDYEPIGYFGIHTAKDVRTFQERNNLTPTLGYFGPKTKEIMKKYSNEQSWFERFRDFM